MNISIQYSPLADHLTREKIIDREILLQATEEAAQKQMSVIHYLIEQGHLASESLARSASSFFHLPIFDLPSIPVKSWPIERVPWAILIKTQTLPLSEHKAYIEVAMIDPGDPYASNLLKFYFGKSVRPKLVRSSALKKLFDQLYTHHHTKILSKSVLETSPSLTALGHLTLATESEEPLIQFVNAILEDAFQKKASDIHFEPGELNARIRFRIDGLLYDISELSTAIIPRLIARLKIMAQLDIAERRLPQDGHYKIHAKDSQTVDVRMSTCPTIYGEKVVLRLLHQQQVLRPIEQLGFTEEQLHQFRLALSKPQGLILVTGPTGSGKTITLYAALQHIHSSTKNILTIEDPVEINIHGINQVTINPKAGLDFACALRAFLRQDPDIIMIGEIRDLETAQIAIKAAQTGHLVLATLHTNSALQAITRLQNMGIASYLLACSLTLITAQRLIRRLCSHCKQSYLANANLQKTWDIDTCTLYRAQGCPNCQQGYQGRFAIHELLPINEESFDQLTNYSKKIKQNLSLLEHGLSAVKTGLTSLEELGRVIATSKNTNES